MISNPHPRHMSLSQFLNSPTQKTIDREVQRAEFLLYSIGVRHNLAKIPTAEELDDLCDLFGE